MTRYRIATRDEEGEVWLEQCVADGSSVFSDDDSRSVVLTWSQAVRLLCWLRSSPSIYLVRDVKLPD